MLETLRVLPLIELLLVAFVFDIPAQQVSEEILANFRLLVQIVLLLDAKDALRLKPGANQFFDQAM